MIIDKEIPIDPQWTALGGDRLGGVDGYAGYRVLDERGDLHLVFCWSHVRHRFYELAAAGPAPIATETFERIAGLYAIEKEHDHRKFAEALTARYMLCVHVNASGPDFWKQTSRYLFDLGLREEVGPVYSRTLVEDA